jgi:hypothetical protein
MAALFSRAGSEQVRPRQRVRALTGEGKEIMPAGDNTRRRFHFSCKWIETPVLLLHSTLLKGDLLRHLVPGDARVFIAEGHVDELDVHGQLMVKDVRYILPILLYELCGIGDLEILMDGPVRRQAIITDDAALFIGSAAHLVASAELLGNGHVDTAMLRYLISF